MDLGAVQRVIADTVAEMSPEDQAKASRLKSLILNALPRKCWSAKDMVFAASALFDVRPDSASAASFAHACRTAAKQFVRDKDAPLPEVRAEVSATLSDLAVQLDDTANLLRRVDLKNVHEFDVPVLKIAAERVAHAKLATWTALTKFAQGAIAKVTNDLKEKLA